MDSLIPKTTSLDNAMPGMHQRRGLTLIEMFLVLGIMVVLLAVSTPSIEGLLTARNIQNAAEKVRTQLQRARIEAIRTGQIQAFRCQVGGKDFSVQPWMKANDSAETSVGATVMTQTGQAMKTEATGRGQVGGSVATSTSATALEGDITFADIQIISDRRTSYEQSSAAGGSSTGASAIANSGTSSAILLYPDGSTSTAHVVVQDPRGRRLAIQLRGLVGQLQIVDMPSSAAKR